MEDFEFTFNNGVLLHITPKGEDGYTVNVMVDEPLMGTFSDFENLLYGIAPVVQNAVSDCIEFGMFVSTLYFHFAAQDDDAKALKDEIGDILMK